MRMAGLTLAFLLLFSLSAPALAQVERHSEVTSLIFSIYDGARNTIIDFLNASVFKEKPELGSYYGDAITLLAGLTALWLLIAVVSSIRKLLGWILLIGWGLLGLSIATKLL